MEFKKNVKLAECTTFKIVGPARYFCIVKDKADLVRAILFSKKAKLPYFVLGGGSNLLVADKGFNGLVIKIQNTECKISENIVTAGAGVTLAKLVSVCVDASLSGMEWASGIPGATIGGAVRGNAGAFDAETKDIIVSVEALDAGSLKIKKFNNRACHFSYRSSIFKKNPRLIVLSCKIKLKKQDKEEIKKKTREV